MEAFKAIALVSSFFTFACLGVAIMEPTRRMAPVGHEWVQVAAACAVALVGTFAMAHILSDRVRAWLS